MSAEIKPSPEPVTELSGPVPARLVAGDDERTYAMFDAFNVTLAGAFLAGSLFLELDEEVTLELALPDPIRLRGRVVRLIRRDDPGMMVTFVDLGDDEREQLAARIQAARDK